MVEVGTCPKCRGEMREGELFVTAIEKGDPVPMTLGVDNISRNLRAFQGGNVGVDGPLWREYTGRETGWLWKRREIQVLPIKGKRCMRCGYIELYVKIE